jgi:hypothetical protein
VDDRRSGQGERIAGELVEVDAAGLARMDALEGTTEPDGYRRRRIAIAPVAGGRAAIDAWACPKETRPLAGATLHAGPLAAYTPGHAASYKPRASPPAAQVNHRRSGARNDATALPMPGVRRPQRRCPGGMNVLVADGLIRSASRPLRTGAQVIDAGRTLMPN